jgi:hypothetical protein
MGSVIGVSIKHDSLPYSWLTRTDIQGNANVWTWGARVGHSWRMSGDSSATWSYITTIINQNVNYLGYVGKWLLGEKFIKG